MKNFFFLEGVYLMLGVFILLITLFVTTRPFMSQGSVKKGLLSVSTVIAVMIALHYTVTMDRVERVKVAFNNDLPILCESRAQRKVAQTVMIQKTNEWQLIDNNFRSPNYTRPFFIARCIVK